MIAGGLSEASNEGRIPLNTWITRPVASKTCCRRARSEVHRIERPLERSSYRIVFWMSGLMNGSVRLLRSFIEFQQLCGSSAFPSPRTRREIFSDDKLVNIPWYSSVSAHPNRYNFPKFLKYMCPLPRTRNKWLRAVQVDSAVDSCDLRCVAWTVISVSVPPRRWNTGGLNVHLELMDVWFDFSIRTSIIIRFIVIMWRYVIYV